MTQQPTGRRPERPDADRHADGETFDVAVFQASFQASTLGLAVVDSDGLIVAVNQALAVFLGWPCADMLGQPPGDGLLDDDDPAEGGEVAASAEKQFLRPDHALVEGVVTVTRLLPPAGASYLLVQVEDVTQRRRRERELLRLATHDSLTQLPGRAALLHQLDTVLHGRRRDDRLVAVMFIDLDGFKIVNDAVGHAAGDAVLAQTARRLRDAVRPEDMVGRMGGDEFLVICPHVTAASAAGALAERIERALEQPVPLGDSQLRVSASIGLSLCRVGERTGPELVDEADAALHRAKQLGKHRVEVFDPVLRERPAEPSRLATLLRRARRENRLVIHYQPIVELATRRVTGLEALMRIREDDGGLLLPAEFLPVAEATGVLPGLDTALLFRATDQVARWNRELGLDLTLSVNICATGVTERLPGTVAAALRAARLPAERLVLELTEHVLVEQGPRNSQIITALARQGARWAIDDFGTGWASLSYLRRYPVTAIKIDRSFVAGVPHSPEDDAIVETLAHLSRRLSLQCIAEGIETDEQCAALQRMGTPTGQGYLFGRPAPAAEVPALLSTFAAA
ncbi:MAG: hypothetical protein JWM67_609 [Mycobacterium sp.]|nr:hypothetical protein [Mycobacterium sp.]